MELFLRDGRESNDTETRWTSGWRGVGQDEEEEEEKRRREEKTENGRRRRTLQIMTKGSVKLEGRSSSINKHVTEELEKRKQKCVRKENG